MELNEQYRDILVELVDCARAMGAYREDAVITGGLVPLLYRFHSDYNTPRQPPLLTGDLDLTVPEWLPLRANKKLIDCLEQGGFVVVRSRAIAQGAPPKQFFQREEYGADELAPIHGEFLMPLIGSTTDRDGKPKSPREFQDGLNAEALRFLDLLLWKPASFDLSRIEELELESNLDVMLPRLAPYLIQKALCSKRRKRAEKRDKDLAYICSFAGCRVDLSGRMRILVKARAS
jgi:hypothetical protein